MKKKPLMITGGIVVLLFLIVLALPLFINANQFKPTLETQLATALGRQVGIGDISLSIFSGGVTVSDVSIADDPAFSKSPFLTTKSLSVGVELLPLIFSKKLEVRSLTVKDPEVNLIHGPNGTWNYSSLGAQRAPGKNRAGTEPGWRSRRRSHERGETQHREWKNYREQLRAPALSRASTRTLTWKLPIFPTPRNFLSS